ncbi:uncharacterized protein LOC125647484 [Ostrea edulis]|uniref:uncharacterized protein LOC125647484 n=1 Tax=Ostrea edulis TaxID=37623 RepID=UPI0024AF494B|nr:uncharacterized protein LOC125647484 [Ostrea edulis]
MVQQISIATLLISLLGTCTSGGQSLHQTEDRLSYHLSVRATDHHRCLNINDYKHIFDDAVQQNCEPSIALFDKLDKIRQRHHECLRPLVINIKKLNLSSCHCHSNGFSYNFVSVRNGRFQECRRDEHYRAGVGRFLTGRENFQDDIVHCHSQHILWSTLDSILASSTLCFEDFIIHMREAYHTHGEPRCHGACSTITTASTSTVVPVTHGSSQQLLNSTASELYKAYQTGECLSQHTVWSFLHGNLPSGVNMNTVINHMADLYPEGREGHCVCTKKFDLEFHSFRHDAYEKCIRHHTYRGIIHHLLNVTHAYPQTCHSHIAGWKDIEHLHKNDPTCFSNLLFHMRSSVRQQGDPCSCHAVTTATFKTTTQTSHTPHSQTTHSVTTAAPSSATTLKTTTRQTSPSSTATSGSSTSVFTNPISGACKPLSPPTDGQINCGDSTIFYRCTAQCNSGYQFDNGDTTIQKDCDPLTGQFFYGSSFPKCIPTCSPACQNGGTCVQPNVCSCAPGWGGTFCESRTVVPVTHGSSQQLLNSTASELYKAYQTGECLSQHTVWSFLHGNLPSGVNMNTVINHMADLYPEGREGHCVCTKKFDLEFHSFRHDAYETCIRHHIYRGIIHHLLNVTHAYPQTCHSHIAGWKDIENLHKNDPTCFSNLLFHMQSSVRQQGDPCSCHPVTTATFKTTTQTSHTPHSQTTHSVTTAAPSSATTLKTTTRQTSPSSTATSGSSTSVFTNPISGACKPLAPPTDGQINCRDSTIFYRCTAQCNSGYQFDNGDTTIQKDCDPFTGQFFDGPSIPKCIPTCSPACQNGGTCVQPNVCSCAPWWGGTFCESLSGACKPLAPPTDGQINCGDSTIFYRCTAQCNSGYQFDNGDTTIQKDCDPFTGQFFDGPSFPKCIPTCSPACQNGGTCVQPNVCSCAPGWRGTFCESPETMNCSKILTVTELARFQQLYPHFNTDCSNNNSVSNLIMSDLCDVPVSQFWRPGQRVVDSCGTLSLYSAVATFTAGGYPADGLAGVFVGCTSSTIKIATQECGGKFEILEISRHSIHPTSFIHTASNYFTVTF